MNNKDLFLFPTSDYNPLLATSVEYQKGADEYTIKGPWAYSNEINGPMDSGSLIRRLVSGELEAFSYAGIVTLGDERLSQVEMTVRGCRGLDIAVDGKTEATPEVAASFSQATANDAYLVMGDVKFELEYLELKFDDSPKDHEGMLQVFLSGRQVPAILAEFDALGEAAYHDSDVLLLENKPMFGEYAAIKIYPKQYYRPKDKSPSLLMTFDWSFDRRGL